MQENNLSFEDFLNDRGFCIADIDYLRNMFNAKHLHYDAAPQINNADLIRFSVLFPWGETLQGHAFWKEIEHEWLAYRKSSDRSMPFYSFRDPKKKIRNRSKIPKTIKTPDKLNTIFDGDIKFNSKDIKDIKDII